MNSIGILSGGGMGRLVADWIINGSPGMDVTGFNIDRLHPYQVHRTIHVKIDIDSKYCPNFQNTPSYRADRALESLGQVYKCHFPYKSKETARGAKRSPFYDRMKLQQARQLFRLLK